MNWLLFIGSFAVGYLLTTASIFAWRYLKKDTILRKQLWGKNHSLDREGVGCGTTTLHKDFDGMIEWDNHDGLIATLVKRIKHLESQIEWLDKKLTEQANVKRNTRS